MNKNRIVDSYVLPPVDTQHLKEFTSNDFGVAFRYPDVLQEKIDFYPTNTRTFWFDNAVHHDFLFAKFTLDEKKIKKIGSDTSLTVSMLSGENSRDVDVYTQRTQSNVPVLKNSITRRDKKNGLERIDISTQYDYTGIGEDWANAISPANPWILNERETIFILGKQVISVTGQWIDGQADLGAYQSAIADSLNFLPTNEASLILPYIEPVQAKNGKWQLNNVLSIKVIPDLYACTDMQTMYIITIQLENTESMQRCQDFAEPIGKIKNLSKKYTDLSMAIPEVFGMSSDDFSLILPNHFQWTTSLDIQSTRQTLGIFSFSGSMYAYSCSPFDSAQNHLCASFVKSVMDFSKTEEK